MRSFFFCELLLQYSNISACDSSVVELCGVVDDLGCDVCYFCQFDPFSGGQLVVKTGGTGQKDGVNVTGAQP